jgi:hypothetical protein
MSGSERTPNAPWYPISFRIPPRLDEDSRCALPQEDEVLLIRRSLVSTVWRPLVEASRRRHLRYRRRLARRLPGWEVPGERPIRAAE